MSKKQYDILLDDSIIGTTEFEKADAPMGIVFGQISFNNIVSGYEFVKNYCLKNNIEIISDYPDDRLIVTADIPKLKVLNPNGIEIRGKGTSIEGMDNNTFEIIILGVPYPFYEEEISRHLKAYNEQFKSNQ